MGIGAEALDAVGLMLINYLSRDESDYYSMNYDGYGNVN